MSCFVRRFAACCLALLIGTGFAYGQSEQQDNVALEQLRGYLGTMQDMRAEFRQEIIGPDQEVVEHASGSVVLSKPGRFRWDYREPYERVIVADGEHVWFYEADLEQVTVRRMATGLGDTPAALLTGDEAALEHFELLGTRSTGALHWIQLLPVSPEADFSAVELGFADDELQLIEFVDRLGQRTKVSLSGIDRAPRLADSEFRFEIPAGVDVIGADEL